MLARASLRYFRHHPWQLVLLLTGLALGVAMVVAVDISIASARQSFRLGQQQLHGVATHRISAEPDLPESLYVQLRLRPEQWPALPLIQTPVTGRSPIDGRDLLLQLVASDPLRLSGFRTELAGALPGATDWNPQRGGWLSAATARRLGLAPGDQLALHSRYGLLTVRLAGLLADSEQPLMQNLLLLDIGLAQQLLGRSGRLDAIDLVLTDSEVAAVNALLPAGVQMMPTPLLQAQQARISDALFFNLQALGFLALALGLFLVFNSVWFSLTQRRPVYAQLRAIGLSGRELYRYLLLEVTGLALLGSTLGLLLGVLLGGQLLPLMLRIQTDLYASQSIELLQLGTSDLLKAMLLGVGGSLLAAWYPCRQLARLPPRRMQLPMAQAVQLQRLSLRVVYLLLPLTLLMMPILFYTDSSLPGAYLAVALLLLSFALLVPLLARGLSAGLGRLLRALPAADRWPLLQMVVGDLHRHLSRTLVAAMVLMIAVAVTQGMSGMVDSFRLALLGWLQTRLNADLYISRQTAVPGVRLPLPANLLQELERRPELLALVGWQRQSLALAGRPATLLASEFPVQARSGYRFRQGDAEKIWSRLLAEPSLLLSEPLANRLALRPGDRLTLNTPAGEVHLPLLAVYYDYGSDSGRLMMARRFFQQYWPGVETGSAALYLQPGTAENLAAWLQQQWGEELGLQVVPAAALLTASERVFDRTFRITEALRVLTVLVALFGIVSALLALQLERSQEVSLLKALGFSPAELFQLLSGQALLLGLVAGLVAIPCAELLAWWLTEVVQLRAFGWSIPYRPQAGSWWQALLLAGSASLLVSIYPAWRFARRSAVRRAD
ncbi:ABC transporter permease [Marinobacterium arenosum]|uniref:ABC transporter permease n=1 Tax=Marinobacterium arenosum TaxID=2862496 RepID=UPI001C971176|nr:FtsX-like permease family protein [Marinobacterium arenosum]MBY4678698.1 FtsX-like permease family protein [Marinobacterium arenosum]